MTVARKLILGFAIGPLFLVLIGFISWGSTRFLLDSSVTVVHTYQVLTSIQTVDARLAFWTPGVERTRSSAARTMFRERA